MFEISLAEVQPLLKAKLLRGKLSGTVRGISTDSRTVQAGNLFVALSGARFDGHEFVGLAFERGAGGAVVSRDVSLSMGTEDSGPPVFLVEDTLVSLQSLARAWRERVGLPLVAITGSNGKTTTKEMTAAVLSRRFRVLKTSGNYNNQIGLPLTLLDLSTDHQVAVVEMGTSASGEIRRLCEIALPNIGILTNISGAHLEFLKSLRGVQEAKAELLDHLTPQGMAILNRDDPLVMELAGRVKGKVLTFGLSPEAQVSAVQIKDRGIEGSEFILQTCAGSCPARLTIPGLHNLHNALAAVAAGEAFHIPLEEAACALEKVQFPAMRMQVKKLPGGIALFNDAYNANPRSMEAALCTLAASRQGGKLYFVAGDMRELGEDAETYHRQVGRMAADLGIDVLVGIGDQIRWALEEARERSQGKVAVHLCDHQEAAKLLQEQLRSQDTVLIKGSRGMAMEKVLEFMGIGGEGH